ncbi:MAG: recombinase family protein, partial [Acidobacteria bacterium]|nr:recombinase family protein [Acidobacteriota bacterium]
MDAAISQAFLKAVQPSHLKVAFKAFEKNRQTLLRHWELQIEKARFEAQRAARQFHAVEPE